MNCRTCRSLLLALLAVAVGAVASWAGEGGFDTDVRPFVTRYCIECHSTADKAGEVDLERFVEAGDRKSVV